ncbi:MAG TPA: hypothetical protein VKK81_15105 [Candidatus Binatia bacterium]|nr:hypothetical protein [Candidatus Binatia bacterium]
MLHGTREQIKRWWFRTRCADILSTPSLRLRPGRLRIVSMVSHLDLTLYLLAIKSLYYHLGEGQITVINDRSLTLSDIELLKYHLSEPHILAIDHIERGKCPQGGTWERLLLIADYVTENYVIQLDSDTLTLDRIPEVVNAVRENYCFTLGTGMGRDIAPMSAVCERMKNFDSTHVQVLAEQNFDRLCNYRELKYVRGCSGFAGFARRSVSRPQIEKFSQEMEGVLGEKWCAWGSEQITSNFTIANSPHSRVLPYPKYSNFTPGVSHEQSVFLHFFGPYRFGRGVYIRRAREMVKVLRSAKASA